MIQLHLEQCELTYEGSFVKPAFSLIDTPGKLSELLLNALDTFGCTGEDLIFADDEPGVRGVTCVLDELDARVTVRGDRIDLYCEDFAFATRESVAAVLENLWSKLKTLNAGAVPRTHSFLFEMNTELCGPSYQELLNRMARPPDSLPPRTESGVVYYLPGESDKGYAESSLVLNRSAIVENGLQVSATLVYDGHAVGPAPAISAAYGRLVELLRNLGLEWTQD